MYQNRRNLLYNYLLHINTKIKNQFNSKQQVFYKLFSVWALDAFSE